MSTKIVALLVFTLALGACGGKREAAPAVSSLTVTVASPSTESVVREVAASGSVAAWQEMILGVELGGLRVARVLVEPGDEVKLGQPLLELDRRTLEIQARQAEANWQRAKANALLAAAQAQRGESLLAQNLISSNNHEELQANRARTAAEVLVAEAERDSATLKLGFATLRAPDDGVISARNVQPGQVVSVGNELLRLIRRGRLEWRAEIAENDLARLAVGASVALRGPDGTEVTGVIRAVSPAIDPRTRTAVVYADLPQNAALRAGMFAEGRLRIGAAEVTVVPRQSVVFRDGFAYLFVLGEADRVVQRRVETGSTQGELIEIRAGVQSGDRVIVRGAGFLADGDVVKVVTGDAS